jgi:hypothetical protein
VAKKLIEELRGRVPYVRRLHRRIDELQHRLAAAEAVPLLHPVNGSHDAAIAARFRAFLHQVQPHDVPGSRKVRFGADGDGGYVMLDDLGPARHAVSLGVGPEVSWDADMAARGLRVFQYDDSVERSPQQHPSFMFHRMRVAGTKAGSNDATLSEILSRPELATDKDIIVKMDIEGSEWDVLAHTGSAELARIRQLVIEFHELRKFGESSWRDVAHAALKNLDATHVCIHVHGNNWVPFTVIGGIPFPDGFEATFVRRRDHASAVPSTAMFPTALDRPNNPKMPDLYIGQWDY